MLYDVAELPEGTHLRADVAVLGAGAAGIDLALRLARGGRDVVVLESGKEHFVPAIQDLYRVRTFTHPVDLLASCDQRKPDIVLLDMKMGSFKGEEVIQQMQERYRDLCIIVVTGYAPVGLLPIIAAEPKAREAHNAAFDEGKAGSVRCGMAATGERTDTILLIAVDQPRPASFLRALLDAHAAASTLITAPTYDGHRGHPLIFDRALLAELRAVDDATLGVRAVLERHSDVINDVQTANPVARFDLNTPDDIACGLRLTAD